MPILIAPLIAKLTWSVLNEGCEEFWTICTDLSTSFAKSLLMTRRPGLSRDSFFDSPPEPAFLISNITEWRKDIPTPVTSVQDFPFTSDLQDMNSSDFFELKDTASECSMDSAYQSQSGASRHGTRKPDGPQDTRSRMSNQFVSGDIYSPSLSSDSYNAFPDQTLDMNQMQPSTSAGNWDAPEGSVVYANYSAGQDFSQYSTTNIPRFTPASTMNISSQWSATDAQFQNSPFNFASYPTGQSSHDMMFNTAPSSQRQWSNTSFDTPERPVAVRSSSSYTIQEDSRRASAQDTTFGAFVATPTSTTSVHFPHNVEYDQSRLIDSRNENEDTTSTSLPPQSLDDNDEILSQSETAEAKLEEERTKVARSHPLYQQLPDKDGKYRCPEEGKAGCNHKPTPLKCNYDKYVDSHLKPFRCNKKTCVGVQFSSTACLLRHEREAHGMHGHGARPHLCHFRDCERAVPGHGFPRRYNLFDHMKRVHQYDGPTTEPSPTTVQGQVSRKPVSRKRKASSEDVNEKRQKAVKLSAEQQRQQRCDVLTQEFLTKKQHIIGILTNLSGPSDLRDDIQLTKEVVGLHDICTKYREVFGG
ncbi:Nn.00g000970.m01.CDS01 [Neocucurbitaria sp. VM-36]